MSYSKNYSTSVAYSGSVTYNYPASQSGGSGTAHYSGNIPIDVTINVDTAPFDGSVNKFNGSLIALGGSVSAMNAAQCVAILKGAEDVSSSIINGFFGTINTELSQQLQALDSAIKAVFGLIQQQGKAVTDKKVVMEGDYNRISSRYVKLFTDLDNECHKRIYALDKQSFSLAEKVLKELLCDSSANAAAMNLLGMEEASSSKIFILISSMNRKVLEVLQTLHNYINQETKISSLIDSFLNNEEAEEKTPFFVPAIWVENDEVESGSINNECYVPEYLGSNEKALTAESVKNYCFSRSDWNKLPETERESLNREFNAMAESKFSGLNEENDQRVYTTMLGLWQNAENLASIGAKS